jgi:hypothetical protein
MTRTIRWALTAGLLCGSCVVGMAKADSNDRLFEVAAVANVESYGVRCCANEEEPLE